MTVSPWVDVADDIAKINTTLTALGGTSQNGDGGAISSAKTSADNKNTTIAALGDATALAAKVSTLTTNSSTLSSYVSETVVPFLNSANTTVTAMSNANANYDAAKNAYNTLQGLLTGPDSSFNAPLATLASSLGVSAPDYSNLPGTITRTAEIAGYMNELFNHGIEVPYNNVGTQTENMYFPLQAENDYQPLPTESIFHGVFI